MLIKSLLLLMIFEVLLVSVSEAWFKRRRRRCSSSQPPGAAWVNSFISASHTSVLSVSNVLIIFPPSHCYILLFCNPPFCARLTHLRERPHTHSRSQARSRTHKFAQPRVLTLTHAPTITNAS